MNGNIQVSQDLIKKLQKFDLAEGVEYLTEQGNREYALQINHNGIELRFTDTEYFENLFGGICDDMEDRTDIYETIFRFNRAGKGTLEAKMNGKNVTLPWFKYCSNSASDVIGLALNLYEAKLKPVRQVA